MSKQAKPPAQIRMHLTEQVAAMGSASKVDRQNSVIYGVKLAGRISPNKHGLAVDGTEYTKQAFESALGMYEGAKLKADHPPRTEPNKERSISDTLGKIQNTSLRSGEPYGDLHLLPTHPMTSRLLDAAERMPDLFCLSHNADGIGHIKDGKYLITEIARVNSVDIVDKGATTRSLYESDRTGAAKMKTLKESLTTVGIKGKLAKRLFEMDLGLTPEMTMPKADEAKPDEAAGDWRKKIGEAIIGILADASLDGNGMKDKIMKVLDALAEPVVEDTTPAAPAAMNGDETPAEDGNPLDAILGDDDSEDAGDGDDEQLTDDAETVDDADPEEEEDGDDDTPSKKKGLSMKESRELDTLRSQGKARNLCESLGWYDASTLQVKALASLESNDERKQLVEQFRKVKPTGTTGPKSSGHRNLTESDQTNGNGHVNRLMRVLGN